MKKLLLLSIGFFIFTFSSLNACEGDCVVCHPKLVKEDGKLDKDHSILVTCKTCHTQEEMEKINMGNGCGQDCWDCHDIKKVTASNVAEHRGLQKCIDCHITIDKSMFGGETSSAFSQMPTLDSLMAKSQSEIKIEIGKEELNKSLLSIKNKKDEPVLETTFLEHTMSFFANLWKKILNIF